MLHADSSSHVQPYLQTQISTPDLPVCPFTSQTRHHEQKIYYIAGQYKNGNERQIEATLLGLNPLGYSSSCTVSDTRQDSHWLLNSTVLSQYDLDPRHCILLEEEGTRHQ